MPQKLVWTGPTDARLKRLRREGHTWDLIAGELGISRNAAVERGRRIGARLPPPEHRLESADPDRLPMAAGDPVSWGVITAGTCLAQEPYVYLGIFGLGRSHLAPSGHVPAGSVKAGSVATYSRATGRQMGLLDSENKS